MIFIRDDDIDLRIVIKHLPFLKYHIKVDLGIITSRPFPAKWIKKHLHMYEICNHSHSHKTLEFIKWSEKDQKKDIEKANEIIKKKLGVTPRYFVPPASRYDKKMIEVSESLGLELHPMYDEGNWMIEIVYYIPPVENYDKGMEKICKDLGKPLHPDFKNHFHFKANHKIENKKGWYIIHTSLNEPNIITLEKQMKYLYENKLTHFWKD
jgi:hypothetical protein